MIDYTKEIYFAVYEHFYTYFSGDMNEFSREHFYTTTGIFVYVSMFLFIFCLALAQKKRADRWFFAFLFAPFWPAWIVVIIIWTLIERLFAGDEPEKEEGIINE